MILLDLKFQHSSTNKIMKLRKKKTFYQIIADLIDADPIEVIIWLMTILMLLAFGIGIAYGTYSIFNQSFLAIFHKERIQDKNADIRIEELRNP